MYSAMVSSTIRQSFDHLAELVEHLLLVVPMAPAIEKPGYTGGDVRPFDSVDVAGARFRSFDYSRLRRYRLTERGSRAQWKSPKTMI